MNIDDAIKIITETLGPAMTEALMNFDCDDEILAIEIAQACQRYEGRHPKWHLYEFLGQDLEGREVYTKVLNSFEFPKQAKRFNKLGSRFSNLRYYSPEGAPKNVVGTKEARRYQRGELGEAKW